MPETVPDTPRLYFLGFCGAGGTAKDRGVEGLPGRGVGLVAAGTDVLADEIPGGREGRPLHTGRSQEG